jgi:hypothetical protein
MNPEEIQKLIGDKKIIAIVGNSETHHYREQPIGAVPCPLCEAGIKQTLVQMGVPTEDIIIVVDGRVVEDTPIPKETMKLRPPELENFVIKAIDRCPDYEKPCKQNHRRPYKFHR